ncbi:hypothetical protein HanRHA438_Chr12g0546791 [Helianthus annuus]|nr:hypothetical protein HanPI659440_Chr12g0455681 [Helianthus annuus]KAJ0865998.1 hypothetical protein HanRHA438_Chr12g0546791 [Helianthus annuus]
MDYLQINHPCISIKFHDIKIICITSLTNTYRDEWIGPCDGCTNTILNCRKKHSFGMEFIVIKLSCKASHDIYPAIINNINKHYY